MTLSGPDKRAHLLRSLGSAVKTQRADCGLTRRALAVRARVSERFLAQLETGQGNISVARLQDVAEALDTTASSLLANASAQPETMQGVVALLGLRGAGKSTVGAMAARRLGVPFVELDALVAREAGMSVATMFELRGQSYFRKIERDALKRFFETRPSAVLATSGSIVTDEATFALLRRRACTVWLKASARDHWDRVVAQGDGRPMQDRADAMSELKALLTARKPLYAKAAYVIDTSSVSLEDAVERVRMAVMTDRKKARG